MFPWAFTIAPEIEWTIPGRSLQAMVSTQWVSEVSIIRVLSLCGEVSVFLIRPDNAYEDPRGNQNAYGKHGCCCDDRDGEIPHVF